MAISSKQPLSDAVQKWQPRDKALRFSVKSFAGSLFFFICMLTSLEVMADRYLYPVGDISQAELLERHDAFRRNYENYEVLTEIDGLPTDLEVKILFGTWCHDSEREVPRMLKLLGASGVKEENISLISLDIRKEEPEGRARALDVHFTPTFVFFSEGKELGRIIERPIVSLPHDLTALVEASK